MTKNHSAKVNGELPEHKLWLNQASSLENLQSLLEGPFIRLYKAEFLIEKLKNFQERTPKKAFLQNPKRLYRLPRGPKDFKSLKGIQLASL